MASFPVEALCRRWLDGGELRIEPLAGGFSGSPLWQVVFDAPAGSVPPSGGFVLKAFPPGWPRARAEWVHGFAGALWAAGVDVVAKPVPCRNAGETVQVDDAGRAWELLPLLPGRPVVAPTPPQARAALETLARIHRAAVSFPGPPGSGDRTGGRGVPRALLARCEVARGVLAGGWENLPAPTTPLAEAIDARRRRATALVRSDLGRRLLEWIALAPLVATALQTVLRDCWSDHVLFEGPRLGGIVDLHAAGIDTPAADLARLLGSWRGAGGRGASGSLVPEWREAIGAYERVRPLATEERALVDRLHAGGVVGGLDHWFRWVIAEERWFGDAAAVLERVDVLLESLDSVVNRTDGGSGGPH